MSECYHIAANAEMECADYFIFCGHMYAEVGDKPILRNAALAAIFTMPIAVMTIGNILVLLLVLSKAKTHGCVHREFGMTLYVFIILGVVMDNILTTFFLRSFPWIGGAAIEVATRMNAFCKFFAFLRTFFSAARSNLMLAHVILHVFTVKLHSERVKIASSSIFLNVACVAVSGMQAIPTWLVYGNWVVCGRFACLPDPEWPMSLIVYYNIHEVMFCDGVVQSVVTILGSIRLKKLMNRLGMLVDTLYFKTDAETILFEILWKVKQRMARKQECYRIVALHGILFSCFKIGQAVVTFVMGIQIYVSQKHIRTERGWRDLLFLSTIRDLFMLLELCSHLVHTWCCYMWQLNLHNCCITSLLKICRPFRRIRRFLNARIYQDEVLLETREHKKKRKKNRGDIDYIYINYLQTLSSRLTDERLDQCLEWLTEQDNLPQELKVFLENMGY
ncbi:unnamed protein product [Schistocephalus solidus]|uniref:G_PROTEIN_RECEP_F1_2 domain-containing protein n=1 Tax=Schistocephalus solidus TaxID=70667 RepID=A0A183TBJ4_SCHSO|nr:unnamed protein product [Schistocephalus solidus]